MSHLDAIEEVDTREAQATRRAIRAIADCDLSPEVVAAILETLSSRLSTSNHKHIESTIRAIENIDDAIANLEGL